MSPVPGLASLRLLVEDWGIGAPVLYFHCAGRCQEAQPILGGLAGRS